MKQSTVQLWIAIIVTFLSSIFIYGMWKYGEDIWGFIFVLFIVVIFNINFWNQYFKSKDLENFQIWYDKNVSRIM
jgi:hypothetical protein